MSSTPLNSCNAVHWNTIKLEEYIILASNTRTLAANINNDMVCGNKITLLNDDSTTHLLTQI